MVRQGASPALRDFCRQTGLRVITTFMGKGVIDAGDDHFLFTAGLRSQDYPQGLLGRADLVVTVGYDMVEWPPSAWNPEGRQKIVCIDTVPPEIDGHFVPEVELIGNLGHILTQLGCLLWNKPLAAYDVPPYRRAFAHLLDTGSDDDFPVKPQRVLRDLRAALAGDDILISDVGAHKLWVARFWEAREPNTVLISNGFAAMGFGLPAAIAAALAGARPAQGRVHHRRRRLPHERPGARDGQAPRAAVRRAHLERTAGTASSRCTSAAASGASPGPASRTPTSSALARVLRPRRRTCTACRGPARGFSPKRSKPRGPWWWTFR